MSTCQKCGTDKENIEYWDTHQTMSDGHIWCANYNRKGTK